VDESAQVYVELWVSFASLLRSYTAAHGLNGNRQATVELGETRIVVRHGEHWLDLERDGSTVIWKREDGSGGVMELTEYGRLRPCSPTLSTKDVERMGHPNEEEMDIVAEEWARELMR
jgi:hypothetical protein